MRVDAQAADLAWVVRTCPLCSGSLIRVGSGDFGSALAKSAARRVSKYAATSTMMIMVTTPLGQMLPDHSRNHPYQTPASVSVTITIGTTIQRLPSLW
jgi:hypothetical protein